MKLALPALAAALVLGLSAGTAQAGLAPFHNFYGQVGDAPTAGTSVGTAFVEDGGANNFSGVTPWVYSSQLLLETAFGADCSSLGYATCSGYQLEFAVKEGQRYGYSYAFYTNLSASDAETAEFFALVDDGASNLIDFVSVSSRDALTMDGPLAYTTGPIWNYFTALTTGVYTITTIVGTSQAGCLDGSSCFPSFAIVNGVPEPGTFALAGLALFGIVAPRLRRRESH